MLPQVVDTVPVGRCGQEAPGLNAGGPRAAVRSRFRGIRQEENKVIPSFEENDGGAAACVGSRDSRDEGEVLSSGDSSGAIRKVLFREEVLDHVLFRDGDVENLVIVGYDEDGKFAKFVRHQHGDVVGGKGASTRGV